MNITTLNISLFPVTAFPDKAVSADSSSSSSSVNIPAATGSGIHGQEGNSGPCRRSDSVHWGTDGREGRISGVSGAERAPDGHELTTEEIRQIDELQQRDREVHAHEQAHMAAGGRYVRSGASYQYETGPDGKKYAIGGEVSIDTSEKKDPRATIRKMETVRKAALAPARPSAQDRAIAARASRKMAEASAELAEMQAEEKAGQAYRTWKTDERKSGTATPSPDMSVHFGPDTAMPPVTGSIINAYI